MEEDFKGLSADELIEKLDYCGYDPYYDSLRKPVVKEIKRRLKRREETKTGTVGDVISALVRYSIDWDGDNVLMYKNIYGIEVHNCGGRYEIEINFQDAKERDVMINMDGKLTGYVN